MDILNMYICNLFFILLERPWLLYGIIIGLSLGYVILIIGASLYGFIKLGRWMSTFFERERQQAEPNAIQLGEIQQNLNQA